MKNYTTLLFFLLIFCEPLWTQSLAGRKVLEEPIAFRMPFESIARSMQHDNRRESFDFWIVYSDRNSNSTYGNPGGNDKYKTINYLDDFYVMEERGDYLNIVKDPDLDPIRLTLSDNAEDYGWINKRNLLLWRSSIITDDAGLYKKAMTQNTIDHLQSDFRTLDAETLVNFYYCPDLNEATGEEIRLYQIFYVFKITDEAVLLGKESRLPPLDASTRRQIISGWVPKSRLIMWDHRIAIEPNWMEAAVSERRSHGVKASIFQSPEDALQYRGAGKTSEAIPFMHEGQMTSDGGYYNQRQIGEWQRYPVYYDDGGILKVGVMGEITTESGHINQILAAQAERETTRIAEQRRNVNIVFVMDGTNSMQPFFDPASHAIVESMQRLSNVPNRRNILRFGAVVFRDEAERKFGRLVEVKPLTEDYHSVSNWLSKVEAVEFGDDKDLAEAVYYGLRTALMSVLTEDQETNIIVLVGDAGNHNRNDASQVGEGLIVDLLAAKNVGFIAFQVFNEERPTFDDFQNQTKHLLLNAANRIFRQTEAISRELQDEIAQPPTWVEFEPNAFRLDNHTNMSRLLFPEKGDSLPTDLLTEEIINIVEFADQMTTEFETSITGLTAEGLSLSEVLEKLDQSPLSNSRYVSSFANSIIHYLSNYDIPIETFRLLGEKKVQLYFTGYTLDIISDLTHPIFKRSLLLTKSELSDIIRQIDELNMASGSPDRRLALQQAWLEILMKHVGVGKTDRSELLSRTIEDIMITTIGLPSTNSFINNIRLEDLTNPGAISDPEIAQYIRDIDTKHRELNRIFNMVNPPYRYSFRSYNETYYWIEESLLP